MPHASPTLRPRKSSPLRKPLPHRPHHNVDAARSDGLVPTVLDLDIPQHAFQQADVQLSQRPRRAKIALPKVKEVIEIDADSDHQAPDSTLLLEPPDSPADSQAFTLFCNKINQKKAKPRHQDSDSQEFVVSDREASDVASPPPHMATQVCRYGCGR